MYSTQQEHVLFEDHTIAKIIDRLPSSLQDPQETYFYSDTGVYLSTFPTKENQNKSIKMAKVFEKEPSETALFIS